MNVDFVPDEINGKVIAYELPDPNLVNNTIFCCDPVDDDTEKTSSNSNMALAGVAKPFGAKPARLICEYVDRPVNLVEFYQQTAYILMWYKGKLHIELNKGGFGMLRWFQEWYPDLLALLPASYNSVKGGVQLKHGYRITAQSLLQMRGLGDAYVEEYYNWIPSLRLIEELKVLGAAGKDDDLGMAFLACLMILQGDRTPPRSPTAPSTNQPTVEYVKQNGVIRLITNQQEGLTNNQTVFGDRLMPPQPGPRKKSVLFKGL